MSPHPYVPGCLGRAPNAMFVKNTSELNVLVRETDLCLAAMARLLSAATSVSALCEFEASPQTIVEELEGQSKDHDPCSWSCAMIQAQDGFQEHQNTKYSSCACSAALGPAGLRGGVKFSLNHHVSKAS